MPLPQTAEIETSREAFGIAPAPDLTQNHISTQTPMGANLIGGGATFRVWAPRAKDVYLVLGSGAFGPYAKRDADRLTKLGEGHWAGFAPGVVDGQQYKFFVVGEGGEGYKRDPYARELTSDPGYPHSNCVVRDPGRFPWHDADHRTPDFSDLVVYQLHVGTFYGPDRAGREAKFLDVLSKLDHLVALGVNAVEPLPIVEFPSPRSMGYDGSDLYSPEMDYAVPDGEIEGYRWRVNDLLAARGKPPLAADQLSSHADQFRAFVDVCHLYGLAVILDVVYNHAGGAIRDDPDVRDESLYFFDRAAGNDPNNGLYFTDQNHTGPVFAFWNRDVRQFLINNAAFFLHEYHVDGFRYDQVTVIVEMSGEGWPFCQAMTGTVRFLRASAPQVAEYWGPDPAVVKPASEGGAGFDIEWHDGLRRTVRDAISAASRGRDRPVSMTAIAAQLVAPGFPAPWRAVQYVESHDEVYSDHGGIRIATLADPGDPRSWYARSRSRVAAGIILTAPGIPMMFMGQETLESRSWHDTPGFRPGTLLDWDEAAASPARRGHFRFMADLVRLRRRQPALRRGSLRAFAVHDRNRVLGYHRWIEGEGRDVVVVVGLGEATFFGYELGFPGGGAWLEVFNGDVYDNDGNPAPFGNGGSIRADGPPRDGMPASAAIVIPANGVLAFARDRGD